MNYSECQEDNYYISVEAAKLVADYLLVDLPWIVLDVSMTIGVSVK